MVKNFKLKNGTTEINSKSNGIDDVRVVSNGAASSYSANRIEDTQWIKYRHKTGHGFAAEDVNAQIDRWHGRKVDCVGKNNAPNGADRIVNGQPYQTKYCQTARETVNAAFDSRTGMYRYDGMKLEVPADQYEECIRRMRDAISQGKVAGVTDPEMASSIVVKGHVTYAQAHRVAKAGNWDSIKFDMRTQTVSCVGAGAITAAIVFFNSMKNGMSTEDALKEAAKSGSVAFGTAMVGGVAAQQVLRTTAGRSAAALATKVVKPIVENAMKTEVCKQALIKTASVIAGKKVAEKTAVNILTKAARTNLVVGSTMFLAASIPDTVRLCKGKISGADYAENLVANAAGVGGGLAGASAGAAVGTMVCPGIGTAIGGLIGGISGGVGASGISRAITGCFRKKR